MVKNKFGEMIFSEDDVIDLAMQGQDITEIKRMIVDQTVDLSKFPDIINPVPDLLAHKFHSCTVPEFHAQNQKQWHMPDQYQQMDIAKYVVDLCESDLERQRVGQELLLFYDHGLFDLLKYLKYLVDTMRSNNIIWGVGRGSSVSSYVLYLIGVHRINSIYYDLDPKEFLR
jgi:DNA polymerase III alpha subunit